MICQCSIWPLDLRRNNIFRGLFACGKYGAPERRYPVPGYAAFFDWGRGYFTIHNTPRFSHIRAHSLSFSSSLSSQRINVALWMIWSSSNIFRSSSDFEFINSNHPFMDGFALVDKGNSDQLFLWGFALFPQFAI